MIGSDADLARGDEMRGDVGALTIGHFSVPANNNDWTYKQWYRVLFARVWASSVAMVKIPVGERLPRSP